MKKWEKSTLPPSTIFFSKFFFLVSDSKIHHLMLRANSTMKKVTSTTLSSATLTLTYYMYFNLYSVSISTGWNLLKNLSPPRGLIWLWNFCLNFDLLVIFQLLIGQIFDILSLRGGSKNFVGNLALGFIYFWQFKIVFFEYFTNKDLTQKSVRLKNYNFFLLQKNINWHSKFDTL